MAAIVDAEKKIDLNQLALGFKSKLPSYARPLFLRVVENVPLTGTFKLKKRDLQIDGYNMEKIKDDLYFLDTKTETYMALNKDLYCKISKGTMRL